MAQDTNRGVSEQGVAHHFGVPVTDDPRTVKELLALVRRLALGLLKRHPGKESMACKRLAAAYDTDFLEEILQHGNNLEKE